MNFSTPSGKRVSLFASNVSPTTFRIMYNGASKHTFHDNAGLSIGTQTNPGSSSFHAVGNITGSNLKIGDVVSSGNIIGSSTSTGSFGILQSTGLTANESVIVGADGKSLTSSDLISYDTVNSRVGIGTTSPSVKLDIVGEASGETQVRMGQHSDDLSLIHI